MWEQADERAKSIAKEAARWKETAEQLRLAQKFIPDNTGTSEIIPTWSNAPKLIVGDVDSLDDLCKHLEEAAKGRIVFTPAALAAWGKADRYGTPDDMAAGLIKLSHAAHDIYDGQQRTMGHMDTWLRETYDLKASLQDDDMPKKFRQFDFEGETLDRTPHVKVNDGVPPHECGRIYFAFDKSKSRIVVDHIGLHW